MHSKLGESIYPFSWQPSESEENNHSSVPKCLGKGIQHDAPN